MQKNNVFTTLGIFLIGMLFIPTFASVIDDGALLDGATLNCKNHSVCVQP